MCVGIAIVKRVVILSTVAAAKREIPTLMPGGQRIGLLSDGMLVHDLITHTDERGTVCELYDSG